MAWALTLVGAGCQGYSTDYSAPVAIALISHRATPGNLEEFDTLRLGAEVLDRAGDSVRGAPIRLLALDTTIAVDSAAFAVTGRFSGLVPVTGRVIAISNALQSAPLVITVLRAPDSLAAVGPTVDTVAATDSVLPAPLAAQLLDLRSDTVPHGLNWGAIGDTVKFAIVDPPFDSLAVATATLGNDSLTALVVTSTASPGTATIQVRRQGSPQPDSVVVQATAHRAAGTAVKGSPVTFVVRFQ